MDFYAAIILFQRSASKKCKNCFRVILSNMTKILIVGSANRHVPKSTIAPHSPSLQNPT
jgi:hypothetical protein